MPEVWNLNSEAARRPNSGRFVRVPLSRSRQDSHAIPQTIANCRSSSRPVAKTQVGLAQLTIRALNIDANN